MAGTWDLNFGAGTNSGERRQLRRGRSYAWLGFGLIAIASVGCASAEDSSTGFGGVAPIPGSGDSSEPGGDDGGDGPDDDNVEDDDDDDDGDNDNDNDDDNDEPEADSCALADNGRCDEPDRCEPGTDTTDCNAAPHDTCEYAGDGQCDEPEFCEPGTDTADCGATPNDSCEYAGDGQCDEPEFCEPGTDTTDCGGEQDGDSCEHAGDGECDEPGACAPGTDTTDCDGKGDTCQDDRFEPNEEQSDAAFLGSFNDFDNSVGQLSVWATYDDADHYVYHCEDWLIGAMTPFVSVQGVGEATICHYLECTAYDDATVDCPPGSYDATSDNGAPGCCTSGDSVGFADFACTTVAEDDSADIVISVHHDDTESCSPYTLTYGC